MTPTRQDVRESIMPMLRGTGIGSFFGALPGTGASIASFMSYAVEKKVSKTPEKFGNGAIEGITAPESANNAAAQTAFVPTLSLGIPGDAVMALMLGALIIHGIQPGPLLMTQQPELFWGLIVSFGIGNIMLMVLNLPMIGLWVAILRIPYRVLFPAILVFISLGVYSVNNNTFDVIVVAIIGALGYLLAVLRFEAAPLLLGFVLGPLMEENLRRALLLSRGEMSTFIDRPISAGFLAFGLAIVLWSAWGALKAIVREREQAADRAEAA
jgi:putative tricarboxylic transport membrane protein